VSRSTFREGGPFEELAAYSRAVRTGDRIVVSGTAVFGPDGKAVYPGDAGAQARESLRRGLTAIESLGGRREDVIRTRIFLVAGADWRGPVEAHRELFAGVDPANTTLFVHGLIPEGALVEIELEAVVGSGDLDAGRAE
jgi:enamine deaminase RidA (YjgF/YER057c/UK114 family)